MDGYGMEHREDIIVADRLGIVGIDSEKEYLAHLLCLGGTCRYRFNERDYALRTGICRLSANGKCSKRYSLRMIFNVR